MALYQMKNIPETGSLRFQSLEVLTEQGIPVSRDHYEQMHLGRMQPEDTPESIRERFNRRLSRNF